jgi:hypothetical protein
MRPNDPETFRDFLRQQKAMLKTALARPAFDMEINPTRPFVTFRRVKPFLLLSGEVVRMKASARDRKKNETKGKSAKVHGPKIHAPSMSATFPVSNEY